MTEEERQKLYEIWRDDEDTIYTKYYLSYDMNSTAKEDDLLENLCKMLFLLTRLG